MPGVRENLVLTMAFGFYVFNACVGANGWFAMWTATRHIFACITFFLEDVAVWICKTSAVLGVSFGEYLYAKFAVDHLLHIFTETGTWLQFTGIIVSGLFVWYAVLALGYSVWTFCLYPNTVSQQVLSSHAVNFMLPLVLAWIVLGVVGFDTQDTQNHGNPPQNHGNSPQNHGNSPQNHGNPPQNNGDPPQNKGNADQLGLNSHDSAPYNISPGPLSGTAAQSNKGVTPDTDNAVVCSGGAANGGGSANNLTRVGQTDQTTNAEVSASGFPSINAAGTVPGDCGMNKHGHDHPSVDAEGNERGKCFARSTR